MKGRNKMKIILKYQEPETHIDAYKFSAIYDESEIKEASEELEAARRVGYEITQWSLVHNEDAERIL